MLSFHFQSNPDTQSISGLSPLLLAVQKEKPELVSYLAKSGASVHLEAKNGISAMHLAAQKNSIPIARILLEHGAEIDKTTKAGEKQ